MNMVPFRNPRFPRRAGLCVLLIANFAALSSRMIGAEQTVTLKNRAYQLAAAITADGTVDVRLDDLISGLCVADGPCIYRASENNNGTTAETGRLEQPVVKVDNGTLIIQGKLLDLELTHTFALPKDRPLMEERILLRNSGATPVALSDLEVGMTKRVADASGRTLPELAQDRWSAVPFLARATDPKGYLNEFSIHDLVTQPGFEPHISKNQAYSKTPSRHRPSEAWAWKHGDTTLGVFSFSQENMLFSVVSQEKDADGVSLRFGGVCMISGEPAALSRIASGRQVDLGMIRYQTVSGGYNEASYAYRALLDEKGCRFPVDYNPPVHWEQLYDMNGAWQDRPHRYTKTIVEKEAEKGREYGCEALYLDPGWDTDFGTFLWGGQWLGPRKQFIEEMKSEYGLGVSLHCPLATWMSHHLSWGIGAVKSWPQEAKLLPPPNSLMPNLRVPALRDKHRNLALLPSAKPNASSVFSNGEASAHQIAHLNDGWFGNAASWIAGTMPAWAEIDLGAAYQIAEVRVGNDHALQFTDRAASEIRILVASDHAADSSAPAWKVVAQGSGEALQVEKSFAFAPCRARWVRVELLKGGTDLPRLDEIQIYEATPVSPSEADSFAKSVKRRGGGEGQVADPLICLGSKQYLDEAEKRLLANCADGVVFLMFDGNWWNGGCNDPNHGHPVPYLMEDHIRANIDWAQRIHAKYPKVLIEMHDPIAGGSKTRFCPVYYKYGLPGSYDENWGFELMWDAMGDLKEGRTRALYYYNLGCNVPIYTHVNLAQDNESCVVLWWWASTCRHLGIGGTSPNTAVAAAQKQAMQRYRKLERFFKRGEFFGISEEIHLHVLPRENSFVVNLFNLSDGKRTVGGSIPLEKLGLDPKRSYQVNGRDGRIEDGVFHVSRSMDPWSAHVVEVGTGSDAE